MDKNHKTIMMDSQENAVLQPDAEELKKETEENAQKQDETVAASDVSQPVETVEENEEEASTTEVKEENPAEEKVETPAEAEDVPANEGNEETLPVDGNEEATANEEADTPDKKEEANPLVTKVYSNKNEVIARLKEIASQDENPDKQELDHLKAAFYKLSMDETEAALKDFADKGGNPDDFKPMRDDSEEIFKAEMGLIKEKRTKFLKLQEEEKEENLKKKLDIIEKIKNMATSPDAANKAFQEFKELQARWKEIKLVPADKANELWRNYHLYTEKFYDLLNLNREAREYDFKKNLEAKTKLCELAEKLAESEDVVSAFHQLQELHQQYREIGPVDKNLREEIWARFKAASTVINKRHQTHFEGLRASEEENLTKKTALCEKVEAIVAEENKSAADWDKHTKEIIALQSEWKTIGFAPQKMNVKIFERFRTSCDTFFTAKANHFKSMRQQLAANTEKKRALIEKAKELADSTEWKSTSDKLVALQKEWKTIGAVPRKISDQLWNEFQSHCNKFFEARNAANAGSKSEERANLESKRNIITELKELLDNAAEATQEKVQQLADDYAKIGHVPFRDKDKVFKEYRDVLDQLYEKLNISVTKRRLDNFKSSLKNVAQRGEDALDSERARLMRLYEQTRQEVQTYENNLGFLNASSKKGNSLIDEMNRKVQKLKDEAELIKQKIKAIDQQFNDDSKSETE